MKSKMEKGGFKVAASVTSYGVSDMTPGGRMRVSGWLVALANDLAKEPEAFAEKFVARYLYQPASKRKGVNTVAKKKGSKKGGCK